MVSSGLWMERGVIMTMVSRFKYYFNPIILAMASVAYGCLLLANRHELLPVDLFEAPQDLIVGSWLAVSGAFKIVAVFIEPRWLKKWALIGMLVGWTVISWAYLTTDTANMGYVMAIALTILCGSELYRGDFSEQ